MQIAGCGSAADTQFGDQAGVALLALASHVAEQPLASADHLQQALAGGEVVSVLLEVAAELGNPLAQHGHLDLSRSGIGGMGLVSVDQLLLFGGIERHARRLALTVQWPNLPSRGPLKPIRSASADWPAANLPRRSPQAPLNRWRQHAWPVGSPGLRSRGSRG